LSLTRQVELESPAATSSPAPNLSQRSIRPPRLVQAAGFTLIEVLIALFILTVGLLGIAGALALGSGGVAGGMSFGLAAIHRSQMVTTGTMLAQSKAESLKQVRYTETDDRLIPARFPDEDYGTIPDFPAFRRSVFIEPGPEAGIKRITVTVGFRPPRATGIGPEEQVQLMLLVARRPSPP
jgi:prepilin-type N-terminal cleavage/methylation domain-containing protein